MANASGDHQTMSKFEKKYLFYYHYSAALVIALLLFSETRSQPSGDYAVQAKLRNMYEEALVNSNESLYILQRMYFNPSPRSKYRSSFCLRVNVTIDNPPPLDQQYKCNATFVDGHFISQYVLHLLSDDGYTSRLADLLSYTRTDVFFYTFDPTFYATMQALAISIDTDTSNVVVYDSSRDNSIKIDISGEFEHMPCRDDAVDAMKMILMWVSSIQVLNQAQSAKPSACHKTPSKVIHTRVIIRTRIFLCTLVRWHLMFARVRVALSRFTCKSRVKR